MPATYEPIATQTLGSNATSIVFSSIPSTYTDLRFIIVGRVTSAVDALIRFNSDTGSNYSFTRLSGNGSFEATSRGQDRTSIPITHTRAWSSANPSFFELNIFSYAGSGNKTSLINTSGDQNGVGATEIIAGLWRNTAAITSITLLVATDSIVAGATATLYGIKAA